MPTVVGSGTYSGPGVNPAEGSADSMLYAIVPGGAADWTPKTGNPKVACVHVHVTEYGE
jgi:hypothetical protein